MNRQEFLTHVQVEVRTLEFWLEQEWLVPAQSPQAATEATFSDIDVARGRLIQNLKGGFGVNDEGVDVILHLLDQLHGFRRAFEDLHVDMQAARR